MTGPLRPVRGVVNGITVGLILWALIALAWASLSHGADGLPPNVPDLYASTDIAHYQVLRDHVPTRLHGKALPPWLVSTILSQSHAYSQQQESGQRTPLVLLIGYLTDTRNGRIVAIVETFLHPDTGLRSLRAWVDEGWIAAGRGSGDWRSYTDDRITHQMSIAETARHL